MKKFFIYTFMLLLIGSGFCCAEDSWDDFSGIDRAWDGQKSITNKEFEDTITKLEEKKTKQEAKKRKKLLKKVGGGGTSLHTELNPDSEIQILTPIKKNTEGLILNIPVNLIVDEMPMEKGYYKVIADKDKNGDIYLLFYQSQFFKGKVRACITNYDFDEEEIDFVRLIPYNDNFVKIIFGSLEYNVYAYVRYIQE